jgi:hypothetical protein
MAAQKGTDRIDVVVRIELKARGREFCASAERDAEGNKITGGREGHCEEGHCEEGHCEEGHCEEGHCEEGHCEWRHES